MKMNTKIYRQILSRALVFLLIAGGLASCSPARKAIRTPLKEEGVDYLFGKLKSSEFKYDWLNAKFSATYKNKGETTSFDGQLRIRKDSLIWLSLTPMLGIEAVRLMISQDSVKMINRLNDTYFIGDYEYVNRFLNTNIDYDILQAYLTGNDLSFYENGKFRAGIDNGNYKLSTSERTKLKKFVRNNEENLRVFIQNIWLDPETFKISRADVKEIRRENIRLEAIYSDMRETGDQLFPYMLNFSIWAENTIHVVTEFSRIIVNVPQQFPFKVPASYRPVK